MRKLKIGIFGLWRGGSFIHIINSLENATVYAVCDKDGSKVAEALKLCPDAKVCADFDELLDSGIEAVLLCNYFHQHASYAIRAMKRGIHVFSECTAGATMKECVELCEAVEETGCKYMLAENYPFSAALLEAKRLTDAGDFGRILYAEGEYNHSGPREMLQSLTPEKYHWRAWLPRTYYVTHSLGPLMHMTGQMPVQVSAFAVHSDVLEQYDDFRHNYDAFAMMNCMTDGGALFRFTGCAHMGSPSGYRVVGEYGSAETGRTLGGNLNVTYHSWTTPEGKPSSETYAPAWPANSELAEKAGHGGGDFWTVYNFVEYVLNGVEPFFDVYRGCCMSAVAILGWRSCLENGKVYAIPDFKDKAQRDAWRDDDLTPFPDENGNVTLPCAVPHKK
jgi:predicted dehydrogenase